MPIPQWKSLLTDNLFPVYLLCVLYLQNRLFRNYPVRLPDYVETMMGSAAHSYLSWNEPSTGLDRTPVQSHRQETQAALFREAQYLEMLPCEELEPFPDFQWD